MKCPSCNLELGENAKFCPICGSTVTRPAPIEVEPEPAQPAVEQPVFQAPVQPVFQAPVAPQKPEQKLMGPWGYVGWQILFSIPLVGFILLIVFSFDNSNLNRRNFARSYWCALLLAVILIILVVVLLLVLGVSLSEVANNLQ